MMSKDKIEIRDLRSTSWIWTDKKVLTHPSITAHDYKVYSGLAIFANNDNQSAFPSIRTIAKTVNVGKATVIRSLKQLEEIHIIRVERRIGFHNIYYLLEIKEIIERKKKGKLDEPPPSAEEVAINFVMRNFEAVNPSYDRLYKTIPQREALGRLIKKYGSQKVESLILLLPKTNRNQHAPKITTPLQLEINLGKLFIFLQIEKDKQGAKASDLAGL